MGKKLGQVNPVEPEKIFPGKKVKFTAPDEWLSEKLLAAGDVAQSRAQGWSKDVPQNLVNKTAAGIGSAAPYFAAGAATGGLAGVPIIGGLLRSEVETQSNAAQTYQDLRRSGADEKTALNAAQRQEWPDRVVNAALEPFGALSNKGRLVRTLAEAVQEGVLQEPAQNITQAAAERSAKGSLGDFYGALMDEAKRYPEHFKEVGVPAMIAGGLMGAVTPGLGRKKAAEENIVGNSTESVSALHTPEQKKVMAEYQASTDPELKKYIYKVRDGKVGNGTSYKISDVSPRAAQDVQNLTGIDLTGATNHITPSTIRHTELRHGSAGKADSSLSDINDFARVGYVLNNYDFVENSSPDNFNFKNSDRSASKTVLFKKAVDGTYAVVQAIPDSKSKKLFVVSAWIEKNKEGSGQKPDAGSLPPEAYVRNEAGEPSIENLSQNTVGVNELNSIQRWPFEPVMPRGNEVSDVKAEDVKRLISEALGVPVRERQIRKKGVGGFISLNPYNNQKNDIIRVKGRNDIASLLHEFGHGIDHLYGLTSSNQTQKQVWPEFAKFGQSMGYKPNQWLSEGLAQFYQWRGVDPAQAYKMFPEYSKIFDEFIATNPEARSKIEPVFKAAHDYYFGSPETRLDAVIGTEKRRRSPKQWASDTWRTVRKEGFDRQQVFSDVGDLVAEAVDNPEMMEKLGIDRDKVKQFGMKRMLPDEINLEAQARTMPGSTAVTDAKTAEFVKNLQGFSNEDYAELRRYMTAGGGLDYFENGMNPGLGLSASELNSVRARTPEKIRRAAANMRAQYDRMMDETLVRTGMLSREKLAEWRKKYPNYVPMLHDDGDGGYSVMSPQQARGKGFVDLKDPIGRRIGVKDASTLSVKQDPVISMLQNYKKFYDLAARNDVGQTMINISKLPGLMRVAEKVPTKGENTFTVWENGKQHYYATDPEIYSALKSLGEGGIHKGAFFKYMHNVSEFFKAGTTRYNPWFVIKNFARDTFTSSVQSGSKITDLTNLPIVNTLNGVLTLLNDKPMYEKAKVNGVFYSSIMEMNRENIPKMVKRELSGGRLKEGMRSARAALNKLGAVNETVELAPKMREFAKLTEMGIPAKQAAMEAREVNTDFQRAGNFGRVANRYVPFFNAQLQGVDKAVRTFAAHPVESGVKAGLFLTLPSVLEWILYHDDKDYQNLDKGIKDTNWVIKIPGGNGQFWRVPMPFEIGVLFGGGTKRAMDKLFMSDPAAAYKYMTSVKEAVLPDMQIALLRPGMEVWANKDSFRDRPIVPMREQDLPARQQYGGSTSYIAKLAGKAGVSPRKVDHLIRGYGGTMAGQAAHLSDVFDAERAPAPAKSWSQRTLLRPYTISSLTSNHYQSRFYDVAEELERENNGAKAEGRDDPNAGLNAMMRGKRKYISNIWKRIGQIRDAQGISPAAKKTEIDRLTRQANDAAKQALELYDKRRGAM